MTAFTLLVVGEEESFRFVKKHLERDLPPDLVGMARILWARSQEEAVSLAETYYLLGLVVIDVEDYPTPLLFQTIQAIKQKIRGRPHPQFLFIVNKTELSPFFKEEGGAVLGWKDLVKDPSRLTDSVIKLFRKILKRRLVDLNENINIMLRNLENWPRLGVQIDMKDHIAHYKRMKEEIKHDLARLSESSEDE